MKYEEYVKMSKDEYDFLDSIDVKKYLKNDEVIWDCMQMIKEENDIEYRKQYNDDFGLFNCVSRIDFIDYIKRRYPEIGIKELTIYYIYNPDDE